MYKVPLELYRIFCTVVTTGSMSQAAKKLYITQPAVSMAIRQLEDMLGKPLLLRTGKGIKITSEGGVLYEYLRQALSLIETAERKYMEMASLEIGEIKIGASDTILNHYVTPFLEKFIAEYPNVGIKITNRTTDGILNLLRSGEVDIGFVNLPLEEDGEFDIIKCMEIHDCIVGGEKYFGLVSRGIELKELSDYPLMLLERSSRSRRYFDSFVEKNGVTLTANVELTSFDLLVKFAGINFGLSCVIKEFVVNETEAGLIREIPVSPPIPARHVGLVTLKNVTQSYAAAGFTKYFI